MFKTFAKTAAVASALTFIRNATGRKAETHYLSSLGLIALGVVVGASAGLLLAPKSGTELREDMRMKAKQLQTKAGERIERVRADSNRSAETNV